jgi:hypothetical protein
MATAIRTGEGIAASGVPGVSPAIESFEAGIRRARRAYVKARHATEDLAGKTALRVRRHPLAAVSIAAAAGAAGGLVTGFVAGWFTRTRARNAGSS